MTRTPGTDKVVKTTGQSVPGERKISKRPYASPVLIEYGTVAKLTQGTRTRKSDGGNFRRSPCL